MKIEIILDKMGLVTGLRTNWKPWAKNPPNKNLVFEIPKIEMMKLIDFLAGRPIILGRPNNYDYNYGRLYLKALDIQNTDVKKGRAFWDYLKNK